MKITVIAVFLAIFVGLPVGWITSMLLTPVLWQLEPVFHIELAGHSGPSDWVFYVVWAAVIPALFLLFRFVVLPRRDGSGRVDSAPSGENPN